MEAAARLDSAARLRSSARAARRDEPHDNARRYWARIKLVLTNRFMCTLIRVQADLSMALS